MCLGCLFIRTAGLPSSCFYCWVAWVRPLCSSKRVRLCLHCTPATSIISEMRGRMGWGTMEGIRQAFEVCHAMRHSRATTCIGNGLCVDGGDEGNLSQPRSSPRRTCPVGSALRQSGLAWLRSIRSCLFPFELKERTKYWPRMPVSLSPWVNNHHFFYKMQDDQMSCNVLNLYHSFLHRFHFSWVNTKDMLNFIRNC